jgi:hypothetical protein
MLERIDMPQEIRMFVPVAIRAIADVLAPRMGSAAAAPVTRIVDLNPLIHRRILAGEAFDIGLTNPSFVSSLAARGHVDAASRRPFGTIPLALGRRRGSAARPVVRDRVGVATLLREVGTIAYVGAGTSGVAYLDLLDRLGLSWSVCPRSVSMERGTAVPALLSGRVDLLAAPLTTLLAHPGLQPAAILPDELGVRIPLEVFVRPDPPHGALGLLAFLVSSELDTDLAAAGVLRARTVQGVQGRAQVR